MVTYEYKKQETLLLFRKVIALAQRLKMVEAVPLLQETAQHLEEGRFMVVVCGEFRRGKSSLLNAFLNELQDLFPVDIAITTNLVTTITYGAQEKITALVGPPDSDELKKIPIKRNEIRLYVTEQDNPRNMREARLMEIVLPNPQLKQGLILVDTPGVGGLYARHTDATYSFIPNADAIIYVSDVFQPLSEDDLRFIKDRILKHTDHIIFVLTKKDRGENYDKIIENNREKLVATLERPAEMITIIPVSSYMKRSYLKTRDPEDLEDSNFPQLESALWKFIDAGRGRILLARALKTLAQSLGNLRRPIQIEYDTHREQNQQKLDKIQADLQDATKTLERLQQDNAEWQMQLQDGLEEIRNDILHRFDNRFETIRFNARGYITEELLQTPELVLSPVQYDVNELLHELQRLLHEKANKLHRDLEETTDLSLDPFDVQSLYERAKPLTGTFTRTEVTVWESTVDTASSDNRRGGFWGAVGNILSSAGRAIGNFFSGQSNARQTMRQVRVPDRRNIEDQLMTILSDNQREQRYMLENALREAGRAMRTDLLDKIKRERVSWERALKSLQEARNMTATEANARLAILQGPLQLCDSLQKSIQDLMRETISTDDPHQTADTDQQESTSSTNSPQHNAPDSSEDNAPAEDETEADA